MPPVQARLSRRGVAASLLALPLALPLAGPAVARDARPRPVETLRRRQALRLAVEFNDPGERFLRSRGGPFDPYHAYFNATPDRFWADEQTVATDPSFAPAPVDPFRIQDGFLRIEAKPVPREFAATSPKPYVSGLLDSSNGPHWAPRGGGFAQKFGYWEIRCRPAGSRTTTVVGRPAAKATVPEGRTPPAKSAPSAVPPVMPKRTVAAASVAPWRVTTKVKGELPPFPSARAAERAAIEKVVGR